jgi:hypothetical protein
VDGEIALLHTAKLCLQENSPLKFVVTEVAFNIRPEREGGDARLVDKIEDVGGDGGVDPVDDATIDLPPLGVALAIGVGERTWSSRPNLPSTESKQHRHWL